MLLAPWIADFINLDILSGSSSSVFSALPNQFIDRFGCMAIDDLVEEVAARAALSGAKRMTILL